MLSQREREGEHTERRRERVGGVWVRVKIANERRNEYANAPAGLFKNLFEVSMLGVLSTYFIHEVHR